MKCLNRCGKRRVFIPLLFFFSLSSQSEPIVPITSPSGLNEREVQLGKRLFHSTELSRDNSISCASCHKVGGGGDDDLPFAVGVDGQVGPINSPTVLNSSLNAFQFWDGRAATLEEQAEGPIHNPLEMGSSWQEVIEKLSGSSAWVDEFREVYQDGITSVNIARAIATYERALVTPNSPFDRYLQGNESAIEDQAKEGYRLFKRMGCVSCHQGQNVGGNMFQQFGIMGDYFRDRGSITEADYGRFNVTGKERDRYTFKVPGLRNVAQTAPYFHDGSAETLPDAIRTMARYQLGRGITADQVRAIEAFLKSLSGQVREDLL
ncbi:cytochrome-c peroxidase [Porticoccus sp. W117]|uniref:cytochrome-c peroxidase n=1 Tax=Porticoccus sp. W117 TaxID=3054777 RepID=UPI00259522D3|nr:cytochrome-c peroxidase [Porticoccus sp. W117]MDM3871720.1 cytochrome-c peroxidase [Porticoccus sp. W117]